MNLLYLSYWGINDPLTVSTVYPHLKILREISSIDQITFCTIERETDYRFPDQLKVVKGLKWFPFQSGHRIRNKLSDFWSIPEKLKQLIDQYHVNKLLARGAPAGALGYLVWRKTKTPFYVESYEPHAQYMLESGVWKRWDPRYILEKRWERKQDIYASGLMPVAYNYEFKLIEHGVPANKIHTMPCAVPVEEFRFDEAKRVKKRSELGIPEEAIVGVYVGKFGGLYFDVESFELFKKTNEHFPNFHLIICSPHPKGWLEQKLKAYNFPLDKAHCLFVPHQEIPSYLSAADFAYALYRPAPSKRFLSPIKVGEYWASGLPVLITEGIGDDSEIIEHERVGCVLPKSWEELDAVFNQLKNILDEPGHREHIVDLAYRHRSFNRTVEVYQTIFN